MNPVGITDYHAPRVPDIPGLAKWKEAWPSRIQHSKSYRNPKGFENQVGPHEKGMGLY
jgi:cation diffusion facilitator CzcD-associated flavoprotein CzcO